jgi:hypothetical protein
MHKPAAFVMLTLAFCALLTAVRAVAEPAAASSGDEESKKAESKTDDACDHVKWVAKCLQEIQKIKPGMTKGDLLKVFEEGGGLSSPTTQTLVHRECPLMQVDVTFEPRPGGDPGKLKIATISKPYLDWPIDD